MKKKAFTLLELLTVLFILSLLLGLAVFRGDRIMKKEERELEEMVTFLNHMKNVALIKNERVTVTISEDSINSQDEILPLKYIRPIHSAEIVFTGSGATGQSDSYIFTSRRKNHRYELAVPVGFQRIRWKK